jgi:predicted DNA-binding ribbon-helix-helix protein
MLDELKKISSESGNSVSSILRIAIAEYLKKRG